MPCVARRLATAVCIALVALALTASSVAAAETKRVLVVHSFGSTAPPFSTGATAFETTLIRELGKHIDLGEVSLDMARYAQADMEEPFVQLLLKRLEAWQPDLVVPIGAPAGGFVGKYRDRLFPETPVLYVGMDRRTVPSLALRNATYVGQEVDLHGLVEDILQVAPDTKNIVVVLGASSLERYWAAQCHRAFAPFTDRVSFTWVDDLSFEQMLDLAARLSPRSFILLVLLLRDAAGVTHNQDDALQQLHAVSRAPINGVYLHQLGLGIVGGRLYQAELQGVEAARVAIRILRGEPAASFPPRVIPPAAPRYDWRELQRWRISERRLPAGSAIAFRNPTMWQRYRWWIVGVLAVALGQAATIVLLTTNLRRRRRAERALRKSEARVRLAVDSAGVGLWSVDVDTGRVWTNARFRALFQLSATAALTAKQLLEVVHPADHELARQVFEGDPAEPREVRVEFRIIGPDGTQRWIATRGHLDDSDGSRRWRGASVDLTEAKLAEQQLRESESRFRTVADSAPVLIWMSGVDGGCTFFNKPWLDFTGRTLDQELGDGWTGGVHPDDRAQCSQEYGDAFEARQSFALQYRLRRHDGEYRWILDNGVPRYDSHGTFAGFIGSCLDITERLQAEERFRQVFEAAPNAMIMVDRDGRIALVNAQAEKAFGYRRDELAGIAIETLVPERFRAQHPGDREQFVRDPQARPMGMDRDVFARRKDGAEVPVEIALNPIRTVEGLFVVASVIDITERQKAEAETYELRQELAHMARVATMGELTAAIVHEIRQPLAAILTNAQAGLRLLASGTYDVSEVREILDDIVTDEHRAREVIQRLRAMFRKGEVERRPLLLNQVLGDVVTIVRRDAERRRVAVVVDLAPESPWVCGDRIQLQQVLLNLIVNALDAMADLTDRPRRLFIRTRSVDDDHVEIDIADTGPGIAAEPLDSIFRPFFTTKARGMGMGLSVSHSIVAEHGGRLWAENASEGGAVFHIVLPATGTSRAGAREGEAVTPHTERVRTSVSASS